MTRAVVLALILAAGCSRASASDSASGSGSASASVPASGSVSVSASAPVSAPAAPPPKPAPTCGDAPLPPCPLYAWMKQHTAPAMRARDLGELAKALDEIVGFTPPGYTNWASIARDGAAAARAQSLDGVKGACRGCHKQYKDRYRREMRDRPI